MKITQIDYGQIADLIEASTQLTSDDQGFNRVHVLQHPTLSDILVLENSSGEGAGFLIQETTPGEGVHDYLRAIAGRKY